MAGLLAGDTRQFRHLGESQALDSYELEALQVFAASLQAQLGSLSNALHQFIQRLRLSESAFWRLSAGGAGPLCRARRRKSRIPCPNRERTQSS